MNNFLQLALSPLTEGVKNSVLFGWVKDTVKSSVQQAKSGIDLVVTTLDPQMSGLICKKIVKILNNCVKFT